MIDKHTKAEAIERIKRSEDIKREMRQISPAKIRQKYNLHHDAIASLRNGALVGLGRLTASQRSEARRTLARHDYLAGKLESAEQIAHEVGVTSRSLRLWIGAEKKSNRSRSIRVAGKKKPVEFNAFIVRPVACSYPGAVGYY